MRLVSIAKLTRLTRREPQGVVSCALCTHRILWFAPLTNSSEFHLYYDI
jgi:hypothetical protein